MASLSVPVRTVVPSIHPSSSTAVARARLGLHYGCCHYFRQPPFRLLVHAHAGHPRGDPRGRPSRIQHGSVSFARGGVPRPGGVPYRPERGHRGTGMGTTTSMGDDKHGRRQASPLREQLGDEARVGATLAVAHPESSTGSFPSREVASHALVASPLRARKLGSTVKTACAQERESPVCRNCVDERSLRN